MFISSSISKKGETFCSNNNITLERYVKALIMFKLLRGKDTIEYYRRINKNAD